MKSQARAQRISSLNNAHTTEVSSEVSERVLHDIDEQSGMVKKTNTVIFLAYGLLILLGVATGYILSGKGARPLVNVSQGLTGAGGKQAGSADVSTFKDSAIGVIQKGGLDGEGTHQLIREGGPSQTAYLVSSVIDLDQYVGKKVKVWGQTLAAKKAAWLLDVGKIEAQ